MRSNKELVQICIDNIHLFKKNNCSGLCSYFHYLNFYKIITQEEFKKLLALIYSETEKVTFLNSWFIWKVNERRPGIYFWKEGKLRPRLRFLKWLLKKYN